MTTGKERKPYGREQVTSALIHAAAELFADRGVAAVSVRDIATRAGVNHGLIHRHFGSKESLRQKTQEFLAEDVRNEIGIPENLEDALLKAFEVLEKKASFWRVMARTFLDEKELGDLQADFPFVRYLVDMAREEQAKGRLTSDMDPRYFVAGVMGFGLGFLLFKRFILEGTDLADEPENRVRANIHELFFSRLQA